MGDAVFRDNRELEGTPVDDLGVVFSAIEVVAMRTTQYVRLYFGPMLAGGVASAAIAGSPSALASGSSVVLPAVALLSMLVASVGTIAWVRRDRRRQKRE
jgi:hypothetical protein